MNVTGAPRRRARRASCTSPLPSGRSPRRRRTAFPARRGRRRGRPRGRTPAAGAAGPGTRRRALAVEVLPRPPGDLPGVDLRGVQHVGDLPVGVPERLAQHVGRPLGRAELLQQHQHRELERLRPLGPERRVGAGVHRLGQPGADVRLAPGVRRGGRVDGEPRRGGGEERRGVAHHAAVRALPAQPRLLHHVLGLRDAAQHPVGDAEQAWSHVLERGQVRVRDVRVPPRRWRAGVVGGVAGHRHKIGVSVRPSPRTAWSQGRLAERDQGVLLQHGTEVRRGGVRHDLACVVVRGEEATAEVVEPEPLRTGDVDAAVRRRTDGDVPRAPRRRRRRPSAGSARAPGARWSRRSRSRGCRRRTRRTGSRARASRGSGRPR